MTSAYARMLHAASILSLAGVVIATLVALLTSLDTMRMRRWPMVPGEVTSVRAVFSDRVVGGRQRAQSFWTPEVRYRYTVGGHLFESDRLTNVLIRGNRAADPSIQVVLARYSAGQRIEVRYRPERPEVSIVEIAAPSGRFWVAAAIFGAVAVAVAEARRRLPS